MSDTVTDSRFYMWRALFAVAHADNFLALEEQGALYNYLDTVSFSPEQLSVLREDLATPRNIEDMFQRITDDADRDQFFDLARELVWADGKLDEREKELVERLGALRNNSAVKKTDNSDEGFFQGLIGRITGRKRGAA